MTREEITQEILNIQSKNYLLELPTGFGKTKISIEKAKSYNPKSILIVVNRIVHKDVWKEEFSKWWNNCNADITITTYSSLHKYIGSYDVCIIDEAHHLSERCREILSNYNVEHYILLSATVNSKLKYIFNTFFHPIYFYSKTLRNAIDDDILPDPKIFLLPLYLNNNFPTETIIKNPKAKGQMIESSWANRWTYIRQKKNPVKIYCTEAQYNQDSTGLIEFWKTRLMRTNSQIAKNKWLHLCNERLNWLSEKKIPYIIKILNRLNSKRTLTFCSNIKQTEIYGKYCINSKNKDSSKYLEMFNSGKINHITACNILNEGMNLYNCQVGIYSNLNSSEAIIKQRLGRLLRHKNPVIIIPYFKGTREEELVKKMMENYNIKLVTVVHDIKDIRI